MRRIPFVLFAVMLPQSVSAADLSCALTHEDIVYTPQSQGAAPSSLQKHIGEKVEFTIGPTALVTPMGAPCDRIAGDIKNSSINVSCSFPSEGIQQASIKIQIDRETGTMVETWNIVEADGSQSRFVRSGLCKPGDAPAEFAEGARAKERPTIVAAQEPRLR